MSRRLKILFKFKVTAHVYQNNRASVKTTRSNVLAYLLVTRARGPCPQSYVFIHAVRGARQPIIAVKRQATHSIVRARQLPDQLASVHIPGLIMIKT